MTDNSEVSTEDPNPQEADIADEEGAIRIGDIYIPPPPAPACTFDSKGPRLMITHIVSENFKSYAGKQALGPFHKSFSSIVGPNGSGKSNVIDSMLFVFGYKAHKIRSKKIAVLIHNSNKYQNINSCTVTVYFKSIIDLPGDDFTEVPDSAFSISRTAFKDNSSYYCINDRRCQFKEVSKLLRQKGVDLDHNRFLILQGEVEQIAMMKPKAQNEHDTGMLEYLEDIIGSSRFKEPIEILGKRVEELNDQRTEKLNRVKLVEKEKDELEGAKNEAMDYLKKDNEIMRLTHVLHQCCLLETVQQQKTLNEEMKEIEEGLKTITDAIKEVKENSATDDDQFKQVSTARDKTSKKLEESKKTYNDLEAQDVRCRQDLKHCKNENKKAAQTLTQENKKLKELELQPEKLEHEIDELNKKKPSLQREQKVEEEAVAKIMANLKEETKGFQDEKDVHEAKLVKLKEDVDQAKSKMDLAELELNVYLSNEEKEKAKLEDMQTKYQQLCENLEEKRKSVKEVEKHLPKLKANYDKNSKELKEIVGKETNIFNEFRNKRAKLEEIRSTLQASKSRNHVLNAIMDAKSQGIIQGIYGRLGDLGAIDAKYDIAISTACGQLDYIVTDTIDTAQKCVDYLKANNIGTATFLGLDKMEKWTEHAQRKITTPENVPRLFDLVRVNDYQLLPAFYFALRDTLVADDLTQATRIAFRGSTRNRVVTLKGELIDQSGTMSGGGNRPAKGRMGSNVMVSDYTQQDVESMAKEVEDMTEQANNLRRRKEELENLVATESRDGERMERDYEKNKNEINSLCQQEILMKKNIINQEARVKDVEPDEQEVKKFKAVLKKATKEYEKTVEVASVVESEVQRLHTLIMEVCGGKVKAAQKKLENINKKIDDLDKAISKAVVGRKTADRNITQTKKKIKSIEKDIEENEDRISKLNLELDKIVEDARERLQENEELKTKLEEEDAAVTQAKKELRKMKDELAKLNNQKINVDHKLEACNKKIAENDKGIKYWKNEINKIKLHEIEGEQAQELPILSDEELAPKNEKDIKYSIALIEDQQKKKKPNIGAIEEYKKKEKLYLQRAAELEEVTNQRNEQRQAYEDLRKRRLNEFMTGYGIISNKLKEMYQMITLGGDAELELLDSLDPFSEGIAFSVRPPKKSWKNISNLSGGEKTLSSLALVFALHYYKPTPLYVMDEIDAALDFRNVSIVGNYIKERTRNAQFIVISLRNNMFELADRLVGIYKTHDCTKSVTINPRAIEQGDQQQIA